MIHTILSKLVVVSKQHCFWWELNRQSLELYEAPLVNLSQHQGYILSHIHWGGSLSKVSSHHMNTSWSCGAEDSYFDCHVGLLLEKIQSLGLNNNTFKLLPFQVPTFLVYFWTPVDKTTLLTLERQQVCKVSLCCLSCDHRSSMDGSTMFTSVSVCCLLLSFLQLFLWNQWTLSTLNQNNSSGKTVGRGQESQRVLPSWSWFIIFSPSTGFDSLRQVATSSTDSDDQKHQILLNWAGLLLKHAPHHTLIFHRFSSEPEFLLLLIDLLTSWQSGEKYFQIGAQLCFSNGF